MSKANNRERIARFHRRLREGGGVHTSMDLSRSAHQALCEIKARYGLTTREAVEAALLDAAVRGDTFDPNLGKLAREHGFSPDELRLFPRSSE